MAESEPISEELMPVVSALSLRLLLYTHSVLSPPFVFYLPPNPSLAIR